MEDWGRPSRFMRACDARDTPLPIRASLVDVGLFGVKKGIGSWHDHIYLALANFVPGRMGKEEFLRSK